jgi:DNA-binding transcriptional LysR family regulator
MSNLAQIISFIAVVEEQSFAGAARKQGVSTAAISRQIAHLETALNVQLLERSTRRVSMTVMGLQYYQQVKKTIDELHEAELAISGSHTEATGVLHINTGRYPAMQYLLPRLPEFMRQNPKLKIKLEYAEHYSDIIKEGIDIIFGSSLQHPDTMIQRRVGSTRFLLCASKKYLDQYGTPEVPLDLNHHHYLTHSGRNPDHQITFKNHPPVFVNPILWVNDAQTLYECALQGMGIVKLNYYIVEKALQDKRLIEILSEYSEPEKTIFLYYQQRRYLQPKIRRFIDFYF